MKKTLLAILCGSILLSSCSTTESGAISGAYFGSIVGRAVGGLSGGWRGERTGTLIGMAAGAALGAAAGNASEQADRERVREHYRKVQERRQQSNDEPYIDETNSGDDRIEFSPGSGYPTETVPSGAAVSSNDLMIKNIRFTDDNGNGTLSRGETGKIAIVLTNTSQRILYNVTPVVKETTGNKHILVSPSAQIESIGPGQSIRYTAMVVADARLKQGTAQFSVSVLAGEQPVGGEQTINVTTVK